MSNQEKDKKDTSEDASPPNEGPKLFATQLLSKVDISKLQSSTSPKDKPEEAVPTASSKSKDKKEDKHNEARAAERTNLDNKQGKSTELQPKVSSTSKEPQLFASKLFSFVDPPNNHQPSTSDKNKKTKTPIPKDKPEEKKTLENKTLSAKSVTFKDQQKTTSVNSTNTDPQPFASKIFSSVDPLSINPSSRPKDKPEEAVSSTSSKSNTKEKNPEKSKDKKEVKSPSRINLDNKQRKSIETHPKVSSTSAEPQLFASKLFSHADPSSSTSDKNKKEDKTKTPLPKDNPNEIVSAKLEVAGQPQQKTIITLPYVKDNSVSAVSGTSSPKSLEKFIDKKEEKPEEKKTLENKTLDDRSVTFKDQPETTSVNSTKTDPQPLALKIFSSVDPLSVNPSSRPKDKPEEAVHPTPRNSNTKDKKEDKPKENVPTKLEVTGQPIQQIDEQKTIITSPYVKDNSVSAVSDTSSPKSFEKFKDKKEEKPEENETLGNKTLDDNNQETFKEQQKITSVDSTKTDSTFSTQIFSSVDHLSVNPSSSPKDKEVAVTTLSNTKDSKHTESETQKDPVPDKEPPTGNNSNDTTPTQKEEPTLPPKNDPIPPNDQKNEKNSPKSNPIDEKANPPPPAPQKPAEPPNVPPAPTAPPQPPPNTRPNRKPKKNCCSCCKKKPSRPQDKPKRGCCSCCKKKQPSGGANSKPCCNCTKQTCLNPVCILCWIVFIIGLSLELVLTLRDCKRVNLTFDALDRTLLLSIAVVLSYIYLALVLLLTLIYIILIKSGVRAKGWGVGKEVLLAIHIISGAIIAIFVYAVSRFEFGPKDASCLRKCFIYVLVMLVLGVIPYVVFSLEYRKNRQQVLPNRFSSSRQFSSGKNPCADIYNNSQNNNYYTTSYMSGIQKTTSSDCYGTGSVGRYSSTNYRSSYSGYQSSGCSGSSVGASRYRQESNNNSTVFVNVFSA